MNSSKLVFAYGVLYVVKLTDWARRVGVHPKTAYRWFQRGLLPVPAHQLPTGTMLVETAPEPQARAVALRALTAAKAAPQRRRGA